MRRFTVGATAGLVVVLLSVLWVAMLSLLAAALRSAWRQVLDAPEGEPTEVLAELGGEDIARMIVERDGWRQLNKGTNAAELTVGSNRGLVKIIWKHGPKSPHPPELWVEERHIVALPQILRQVPGQPGNKGSVRRVVNFADDRRVIFVERIFEEDLEAGGPRRLITAYVPDRDAAEMKLPGTRVDLPTDKATGGAGFGGGADTVLPATPSQQSARSGRLGLAPDERGPNADTGQGGF